MHLPRFPILYALLLVIVGGHISCATVATSKAWTADTEIARTDRIINSALEEMSSKDEGLSAQDQLHARALRLAMLLSTASFYIYIQEPEIRSAILQAAQLRHLQLLQSYQERHRGEQGEPPQEPSQPPHSIGEPSR